MWLTLKLFYRLNSTLAPCSPYQVALLDCGRVRLDADENRRLVESVSATSGSVKYRPDIAVLEVEKSIEMFHRMLELVSFYVEKLSEIIHKKRLDSSRGTPAS